LFRYTSCGLVSLDVIRCQACKAALNKPLPEVCPNCKQFTGIARETPSAYRWFILIPFVLLIVLFAIWTSGRDQNKAVARAEAILDDSRTSASDFLPKPIQYRSTEPQLSNWDEFGPIIAHFGTPDRDDNSANDPDRPLIPLRIIEYYPEHVKIIFAPEARIGEPISIWLVTGYIDTTLNKTISPEDAASRLQTRFR
jgi:hypothetical protein